MKVKLLTDGGFKGLANVIGETVEVTEIDEGAALVLGSELIAHGAKASSFNPNVEYVFFLDGEAEIIKE